MNGRLLRPDTIPRLYLQLSKRECQLEQSPTSRGEWARRSAGPLGGARGMTEIRRLNERYDAYLRAGQVCLEARGYQVSR